MGGPSWESYEPVRAVVIKRKFLLLGLDQFELPKTETGLGKYVRFMKSFYVFVSGRYRVVHLPSSYKICVFFL